MSRLQNLNNRRNILIQANEKNHYTQAGHPKIEKYYRVLILLKKQINEIQCMNVRPIKARVGLRISDLKNLYLWKD